LLDPKDIESITVLKDKSATAIYGTKGTGGVVIVNTKKNKSRQILSAPKTDYTQHPFSDKN